MGSTVTPTAVKRVYEGLIMGKGGVQPLRLLYVVAVMIKLSAVGKLMGKRECEASVIVPFKAT